MLHLDLHPASVLLGENGPIVIDWCNARRGPAAFDLAMTALILAQVIVTPGLVSTDPAEDTPPGLRPLTCWPPTPTRFRVLTRSTSTMRSPCDSKNSSRRQRSGHRYRRRRNWPGRSRKPHRAGAKRREVLATPDLFR